jgi:uncharacterized protein (TIGR03000 family)
MIRHSRQLLVLAMGATLFTCVDAMGNSPSRKGGHRDSDHGRDRHPGDRYYGAWLTESYPYDSDEVALPLAEAVPIVVPAPDVAIPPPPVTKLTGALVRIRVAPSARMWVDGTATSQTGAIRTFTTPALNPGKTYSYTVRACWLDDGRPVVRTRVIKVIPGQIAELDLR